MLAGRWGQSLTLPCHKRTVHADHRNPSPDWTNADRRSLGDREHARPRNWRTAGHEPQRTGDMVNAVAARNRTMPSASVIPQLVYEDVREAATWLCEAFGASLRWQAGEHRAQLAFGDSAVAITEPRSSKVLPGPQSLMVRVADVDAHHARARSRGARIIAPPRDFPYGERQYTAQDLGGHQWTFSQSIADLAPEEWGGTRGPAIGGVGGGDPGPSTLLAQGRLPPLDRATIHPYEHGTPGEFFYQRYAHPVGAEAERLLGELEGGPALLFPSGSGATTALVLALLAPGARVAVADGGYYGTVALLRDQLARWGIEVVGFDQTAAPPPADLVWLEPCANPMLTFPDLKASIEAAHQAGGRVVVDNTVLSPALLRPLEHGADLVLHSASKILSGHHDALLGAIACARSEDHERLRSFRGASGIVAAPDPVWLMLRGLKTLALRVARQSATALELARRLSSHPEVRRVRYPGLGGPVAARYVEAFGPLLSFEVADAERAARVERSLRLIENATSLGGTASTLEARSRWEGQRVPPGLLRLSAGLEDVEDLWADLAQALAAGADAG
jgi:cystathionine gamma-synthase